MEYIIPVIYVLTGTGPSHQGSPLYHTDRTLLYSISTHFLFVIKAGRHLFAVFSHTLFALSMFHAYMFPS